MENWGLVTYRETALLYSDEFNSAANKQRVAEVVAHELAHFVSFTFKHIFSTILLLNTLLTVVWRFGYLLLVVIKIISNLRFSSQYLIFFFKE
jgi:hypothetical protein